MIGQNLLPDPKSSSYSVNDCEFQGQQMNFDVLREGSLLDMK